MQITVKLNLVVTKPQIELMESISKEYIRTVNNLVSTILESEQRVKLSSKDVFADLPSAVKNQSIRDAISICNKYRKALRVNSKLPEDKQRKIKVPTLKKSVCIWNNQNYSLKTETISVPVMVEGKSKRISIRTIMTDYQLKQLEDSKLGALRITKKNNKYVAQISIEKISHIIAGEVIMGVDLGLKVPAVAVTSSGKTAFFGNGRENKFVKRKHRSKRKKLGKEKKTEAIKKLNDKEQRWMKDKDHKVSRQILNFAKENNVSVIRMEKLTNIRSTARTSRKNEKNLHTWSFYRLAQFIEYKAALAGIMVEYADPKYTSQSCPECKTLNKAKDRRYKCSCGYKSHRDRVGAINIINAPVADGNSLSA